jgi:glucose 1-dehydrogenase
VALVTGAGSGIGAAIARRFARDGLWVFVADVDSSGAQGTADGIRAEGFRATPLRMDVGLLEDVADGFAQLKKEAKRLDVLVNNAGIAPPAGFFDIGWEEWEWVIRVNLTGTFLCSQAGARILRKHGGGAIINMSSGNALMPHPTLIPYAASKGGIGSLTKAMAIALAEYGIRVNAIGPGSVRTSMTEVSYAAPGAMDRILSRTPIGRVAEPEEIAGVAAFLASPDSSYVTGITVYADGGRAALNGVVVRST